MLLYCGVVAIILWGYCYYIVGLLLLYCDVGAIFLCTYCYFSAGCFYVVKLKHSFDGDAKMAGIRH